MKTSGPKKSSSRATNYSSYWDNPHISQVMCNGVGSFDKVLFLRIASFGASGCWMRNDTLAEQFNRSESTISRAITRLFQQGYLHIENYDGHGRKMYAIGDSSVKSALNEDFGAMKKAGKVETVDEWRSFRRVRVPDIKDANQKPRQ